MPSTLITLTTSNPVPKIAFLYSSSDKFDLSAKEDTATPSGQETFHHNPGTCCPSGPEHAPCCRAWGTAC